MLFFLEGCRVIKVMGGIQGGHSVEVIEAGVCVCVCVCVCVLPVVQQSLEILEQSVFVLINETHHRVPVKKRQRR